MAFSKPILIAALVTFALLHSLAAFHVEGDNQDDNSQVVVADEQPIVANEDAIPIQAGEPSQEWDLHQLHDHLVGAVHRHLRHAHDHMLEVLGFKGTEKAM